MRNMRIEADVWHAQLYMWGMRVWKTFASSRQDIEVSSRTNICLYVRVLALASVALLGYLFSTLYLGATFIYYPSLYFGWNYWLSIGIVAAIIFAVILALFLFSIALDGWGSVKLWWWNRKSAAKISKKVEGWMEGTPNRPSIISVAKSYVASHTEDFCAGIEIVAPAATQYINRDIRTGGFDIRVPVIREDTPSLVTVDYISSSRIKFLPVWWQLVGISLISAVFLLCFNIVHDSLQDLEAVWEGECSIGKWENKKETLRANLICNGKETQVTDAETLLSYINDPAKPRCFADNSGKIYCNSADKKRMKKKNT